MSLPDKPNSPPSTPPTEPPKITEAPKTTPLPITTMPVPDEHRSTGLGFAPIPMAIAVALTLIIWFVIPVPEGVKPEAWHLLAIFIGTIAAIIGKAMPIGALAMLSMAVVALTGVTSDKPAVAVKDALSSLSSTLIWLIGIAVMISYGLTKTGLGKRIGYYFISIFGKKTLASAIRSCWQNWS